MAALVQALLRSHGYMSGGQAAMDDEYGPNCVAAARAFQKETQGLGISQLETRVDDGEVGAMTLTALRMRLGVDLTTLPESFWPQAA